MKPPICCICNERFVMENGGLVYFKLRTSDIEWKKKMKKDDMVGHPPYAEWFCEKYYKKAKDLNHLTISEALKSFKL
ncbi:MAG: hypothetical protein ACFFBP_14700 [Promethearchaeota archaeon]